MDEDAPRGQATIVAPATPPGIGAVSIVRLSGPRAFEIARRLTGLDPVAALPRSLLRCEVRGEGGEAIDEGLAAFFPAPRSFTGEDLVEIHLHGNPLLVDRAASAACALGAVPAAPGEFSRRAFQNAKMDLAQAEALADLIAATTDAAAQAALRQLRGAIGEAVAPLRGRVRDLLVFLEAAIDFSDEEGVPEAGELQLQERISEIRSALAPLIASYARGHRVRDGATVVIAGVANVGKSKLLNRLLGEERAIVTEVPGTTRDFLSGDIVCGGIAVRLVDTAGLRETSDPVEREGVRRSRELVAAADRTLFLLDGSRPAHEGDRAAYAEVADRPHLLLLNKRDLPSAEAGGAFAGRGLRGTLSLSAKTGEGVEALLPAVARELLPAAGAIMAEAPLTRLRQVEAARRADEALRRAADAVREGLPVECVAADAREAAQALSELTGEIAPEEVLDAIFGSFCIGK
ncbi:MAG: tRNA uridine-5-carboxymethylaminomethyl(34) synthesis GTPase MnmE [Deltaproteobacteria bacterium]